MVKVYNHVGRAYIKGYGHCPVVHHGNGMEEVVYQSGKTLAKTAIPMIKKAWGSLTPEARGAIIGYAGDAGVRGAKALGRTINQGVSSLGSAAQDKLEGLLGKSENTSRISKSAENMMKKMIKSKKKEVKKKAKKMPISRKLPKSVMKNLSTSEQKQIDDASVNMLSSLLSGQGLRLM